MACLSQHDSHKFECLFSKLHILFIQCNVFITSEKVLFFKQNNSITNYELAVEMNASNVFRIIHMIYICLQKSKYHDVTGK